MIDPLAKCVSLQHEASFGLLTLHLPDPAMRCIPSGKQLLDGYCALVK